MLYGISVTSNNSVTSHKLLKIDVSTGSATTVGDALDLNDVSGLAFGTGKDDLYGLDKFENILIKINPSTGAIERIGNQGRSIRGVSGLAYDSTDNMLYGVDNNTRDLLKIDTLTGDGEQVVSLGSDITYVSSLAYDEKQKLLYGIDVGDLITIDTKTGAKTLVSNTGFTGTVDGLAFDPQSNMLYATENGTDNSDARLITIDPATGVITTKGFINVSNVKGLAYYVPPGPNPPGDLSVQ